MPEPNYAVTGFIAAHGQETLERVLEKADEELRAGSDIRALETVLPLAVYFRVELKDRSRAEMQVALLRKELTQPHFLMLVSDPQDVHGSVEVICETGGFRLMPDERHFGPKFIVPTRPGDASSTGVDATRRKPR